MLQKGDRRIGAVFMGVLCLAVSVVAQEDDDCMLCHGEPNAVAMSEGGSELSLYVDPAAFELSLHGPIGCVACHLDIEELPHNEQLEAVACENCHVEVGEVYAGSMHGESLNQADPLAPTCASCHGKHDIKALDDPEAQTHPIRIPDMCGACHAEDAPVARSRDIEQHDILQHYEESIHGEGVLKKGLTVTAVCTSCHTAHEVLDHTDPRSTIHRDNVVSVCTQCHAAIEQVHRKIIDGQLWESEPENIPICIDCHQPHEARKVYYEDGSSDRDCMACHEGSLDGATHTLDAVDDVLILESTHAKIHCAQCHTGSSPALARPCATVDTVVDCSICHAPQVDEHALSTHGQLAAQGDMDAPTCLSCHAGHGTQSKLDATSPTFPNNVPTLCGNCHREGEIAATRILGAQHNVLENYTMSIHGKGLLESGLVVTATCANCHTAHGALPSNDPASSVHRDNIANTCGTCHHGLAEMFQSSIHSPEISQSTDTLPVCSGCHTAHTISRTDSTDFKLDVMQTCGRCHEEITNTYFDTYHGKVSTLGSETAAKCHDCHGAHDVLPTDDPHSKLSRDNIVETCAQCHEGSHRRFAGYLTHATHHDPEKYPMIFYSFWAMTALLVGTFAFFGLHTLVWLPHSFAAMLRHRVADQANGKEQKYVRRFDRIVRQLHFVLILSFFGLALTGMTLKFSYMPWALWMSGILGGFHAMGIIHRVCAVIMAINFIIHLGVVVHRKRRKSLTWKQILLGPNSLLPQWHDVLEFIQTMKWFMRRGPRPAYGEWTYWEKFDYFAVFWGIAIIGSTGVILWFPELCTHVLPGWFINVATVIHSDEALLATGFIFTIHFFNTHFRPEKFPMDMVMFTGQMSEEELKREKPRFYEQLKESGELETRFVAKAPREMRFWSAIFGTIALVVGFTLVLFIIWSMIFGYK